MKNLVVLVLVLVLVFVGAVEGFTRSAARTSSRRTLGCVTNDVAESSAPMNDMTGDVGDGREVIDIEVENSAF